MICQRRRSTGADTGADQTCRRMDTCHTKIQKLFARGSAVADFFRNRPWPPSLTGWPAAYPDSLLDVRDRARFVDGSIDARADELHERFPRVLHLLVALLRVVDGSPPFEQHDYALATHARIYA